MELALIRAPEWEGASRLKLAGAALISLALHAVAVPAWLRQRPASPLAPAPAPLVAVLVAPAVAEPAPATRDIAPMPSKPSAPASRARRPAPPQGPKVLEAPAAPAALAPSPGEAAAPAPPSPPPVPQHGGVTSPPSAAIASSAPVFDALYLENPAPAYPMVSRRLREQGRVLLRVLVSAEGRAARVEIRASSGFERLDAAAREAVARWRFLPARRGEEPAAAWVLIPISFSLEG